MKQFQQLILATCVAAVSPFAFSSGLIAQERHCNTERPPNVRSHWSYRLVEGRKCWYEGKPMLSKSLLHWPAAQTADQPKQEPNFPPTNSYNFLDAQAAMSDSSSSFEARWRERFLEAIGK
jgi:hypothetical protein